MEFEETVARQLQDLGFPIFYRNLRILYDRSDLSEFDIISYDFIIEVKSGRECTTKGLNFMNLYGLLPNDYKYYIYCHVLSNEEIACLNENCSRKNILYINSFAEIIKNHTPVRHCAIETESVFGNFLNLPIQTINQFDKLYVSKYIYNKTYFRVHNIRDRYSVKDNLKWSDKLEFLMKQNRIILMENAPMHIPRMEKLYQSSIKIHLKKLEQFSIPRIYYISLFKKDDSMIDIYHTRSHILMSTLTF